MALDHVLEPELERCLVLIKPEDVDKADIVLNYIRNLLKITRIGEGVVSVKVDSVPREVAEAHCSVHRHKHFFQVLVGQYERKSVVAAVYEGKKGLIKELREILGG